MPSDTNNVKLGVCTVFFDGVDLGLTKGGVEVEVQTTTHEIKVDQFGETPIGELVTGRTVTAKVPLAETTLENLVRIMPGAELVGDGVAASATVTFSTTAPSANDSVTIKGQAFTFKASPAGPYEMAVPGTIGAAATALANAVNAAAIGVSAVAAAGVVTLTAVEIGSFANAYTLAKSGTNIAVSGATFSGGTDHTKAKVNVGVGMNTNLLSIAKKLVLRPKGTTGSEDFIIPKTAAPGALNFAYKFDDERIFVATFKGYPDANGNVAILGDETAV